MLDALVDAIGEARDAAAGEVRAVGLGIPSLMDHGRGVALSHDPPAARGVAFRDLLAERLGLPVFVDNDANAALLAEHRAGAAQGVDDAVMLTLGTGIGGGILVGRDASCAARVGAAGELGHMVVDMDGPPCFGTCPNHGCLEAVASGSALAREARAVRRVRARLGARASARGGTGDHRRAGHRAGARRRPGCASGWSARSGERLGVGIVEPREHLQPEVVVVGGGVIAAGELLLGAGAARSSPSAPCRS